MSSRVQQKLYGDANPVVPGSWKISAIAMAVVAATLGTLAILSALHVLHFPPTMAKVLPYVAGGYGLCVAISLAALFRYYKAESQKRKEEAALLDPNQAPPSHSSSKDEKV